jgi:hypothetical protein
MTKSKQKQYKNNKADQQCVLIRTKRIQKNQQYESQIKKKQKSYLFLFLL